MIKEYIITKKIWNSNYSEYRYICPKCSEERMYEISAINCCKK